MNDTKDFEVSFDYSTNTGHIIPKQEICDDICNVFIKQEELDVKVVKNSEPTNETEIFSKHEIHEYEDIYKLSTVKQELEIKDENADSSDKCKSAEFNLNNCGNNQIRNAMKASLSCTSCGYKTTQPVYLRNHMKIHLNNSIFSCKFCDFNCLTYIKYIEHMRLHSGEKVFCCRLCEYTCSKKEYLTLHMSCHSDKKLYSCDICDYRCSEKTTLTYHRRSHKVDKPFKCNYCDYRSAYVTYLHVHERIHTKEKPFDCMFCELQFSENRRLEDHLRKHTGEKPFGCDVCEYRAAYKSNVRKHKKLHLNKIARPQSTNDIFNYHQVDKVGNVSNARERQFIGLMDNKHTVIVNESGLSQKRTVPPNTRAIDGSKKKKLRIISVFKKV